MFSVFLNMCTVKINLVLFYKLLEVSKQLPESSKVICQFRCATLNDDLSIVSYPVTFPPAIHILNRLSRNLQEQFLIGIANCTQFASGRFKVAKSTQDFRLGLFLSFILGSAFFITKEFAGCGKSAACPGKYLICAFFRFNKYLIFHPNRGYNNYLQTESFVETK